MANFTRSVRLTRPAEFQRVFQQGKRFFEGEFNARAVSNDVGHPRLGMAIAKKALRRAHERNRIRRLVRESFRQHYGGLPPVDLVLTCRSDVLGLSNQAIFQQLDGLWLRLHKLYSAGFRQNHEPALP